MYKGAPTHRKIGKVEKEKHTVRFHSNADNLLKQLPRNSTTIYGLLLFLTIFQFKIGNEDVQG